MKALISKVIMATILSALPLFEAGASTWQDPVIVNAGSGHSYRTELAFDGAGNAMVVFEQETRGVYRIYANQYLKEGGWQGPVAIDTNTGNAYKANVAFDADGNAIAVFKQEDGGKKFRIYANRYIKGKGWQGPAAIDNGAGSADGQKVAFDREGNAAAVFEERIDRAYGIYANFYIPNKGWQKPVRIDTGRTDAYFPYPAFDGTGNLYVIYYKDDRLSGWAVYVSRYDRKDKKWAGPVKINKSPARVKGLWHNEKDAVWRYIMGLFTMYRPKSADEVRTRLYSGTFSYVSAETPTMLDEILRSGYTPVLVIGNSNDVTAFFVGWDGGHMRGYTSAYKNGKGWSKPQSIDSGDGEVAYMRAAVNSKEEIALVFGQQINNIQRVIARLYKPDSGWGEAKIIDAGDNLAIAPSVVFAGDSTAVATWCQIEKMKTSSYANIHRDGSGWQGAHKLNRGADATCGVKIASGPDGSAISIFEQHKKGGANRIYAVSLGE